MTKVLEQVVSANDLLDGDVVYLTRNGTWTRSLADAVIAEDKAAANDLLAVANDQPGRVVGPTLVGIERRETGVEPAHIRERLRDSGPSIFSTQERNAL